MILYSAIYRDFHPFHEMDDVFNETKLARDPDDLTGPGMLIVHGGADISPSLYGKGRSQMTMAGNEPSGRDMEEWALMQAAREKGIYIMGICRGAQMACALAGGFLIQHVNGHGGRHIVDTNDGQSFVTNSIHHQMMYPFDVKHDMVAHVPTRRSNVYHSTDNEGNEVQIEPPVEPEFVYFPEIRGIAVQWHPEMMRGNEPANLYLKSFISEKIRACT